MAVLRSYTLRPQRGIFANANYDKSMAIRRQNPMRARPEAGKRYSPNSAQTMMPIRLATETANTLADGTPGSRHVKVNVRDDLTHQGNRERPTVFKRPDDVKVKLSRHNGILVSPLFPSRSTTMLVGVSSRTNRRNLSEETS
jgi:hypothetical protein